MNKKRITTILILALIALAIYRSNQVNTTSEPFTETHYMRSGIMVNITLYDESDAEILESSFDLINKLESRLSSTIDSSEVNKINSAAGESPVKVSSDTFNLIKESLYYSELSEGYFDISSGIIIDLWDIGGENARVPSQDELNTAVQNIDYKDISLDEENQTVKLLNPNMRINLGGISKGYIIDNIDKHLRENGVERAIVEAGGDISLIGLAPEDRLWKIGVKDPFSPSKNEYLGIVELSESSIVTSGVYERILETDGDVYHHILNPKTGYPVENSIEGVTVVADNSTDSDALSTSLLLLGLEDGMNLVENLDGVDAIFVTDSKDVYVSSSLVDYFELKNQDFKIKGF